MRLTLPELGDSEEGLGCGVVVTVERSPNWREPASEIPQSLLSCCFNLGDDSATFIGKTGNKKVGCSGRMAPSTSSRLGLVRWLLCQWRPISRQT